MAGTEAVGLLLASTRPVWPQNSAGRADGGQPVPSLPCTQARAL